MPRMKRSWVCRSGLAAIASLSLLCACASTQTADFSSATRPDSTSSPDPSAPTATLPTANTTSPRASASNPGRSNARVSLHAPGYDAPGALVAAVATVNDTSSRSVTFDIQIPGGTGTCQGPTWQHAAGTSQECWITLPPAAGKATISARADLTDDTGTVRTAPGSLDIAAKGAPTGPVDPTRRDTISRCGNRSDRVWLTFDDHFSSTKRMDAMLAALADKNVRGRFFAMGSWAKANPSMIAQIRAAGHLVENHTLSHEPLNSLGDAALRAQISGGPASDPPALMRPGYGAGAYATRVVDTAADLGFGVCYWTVDPRDWAGPTAEQLIKRVIHGDARTPPVQAGGVVLMHMTGKHTTEALPGLIDAIRAKGLTLDPLRQ